MVRKKKEVYPFPNIWDIKYDGSLGKIVRNDKPIKIKNFLTNKEQSLDKGICFMGWSGSTNEPWIIVRIYDYKLCKDIYKPYEKIYHCNVYNSVESYDIYDAKTNNRYKVYRQKFCTGSVGLRSHHVHDNPKFAMMELSEVIKEHNPSSEANSQRSCDIRYTDHQIKCKVCGQFIKDTDLNISKIQEVCSIHLATHLKPELLSHKTGGYYKRRGSSTYLYYRDEDKPSADTLSEYYKPIPIETLTAELKDIPKVDKDITIMGLGSAGSSILEQLARTKLVESYVLVDFDYVEEKNLRNQIYDRHDLGHSKIRGCKDYLEKVYRSNVATYEKTFQDVNFDYIKNKYIVLGFDTIQTRLDAFKLVANGTIESEYIIDTRYDDLTASIYFVDVKDKKQMDYYFNNLVSDGELLEGKPKTKGKYTAKNIAWFINDIQFHGKCSTYSKCYLGLNKQVCNPARGCKCGDKDCTQRILDKANNGGIIIPKERPEVMPPIPPMPAESTCLKVNIIDIYKFASSYITSAMREIYEGKAKPFTHVEVSTDGLPSMMLVRK